MTDLNELAAAHSLPTTAAPALRAVLELIASDPAAPTAVKQREEAIDLHVADSLAALDVPDVARAHDVADIGSGAGFPGLALAAALPQARVRLVESAGRKCAFLRRAVEAAGLGNVEVVQSRVEAWQEGTGACDLVTARALAALPVVVEYAAPLLREGGVLVAWKGRRDPDDEVAGAAAAGVLGLRVEEVRRVRPFAGARERHLHMLRKFAPTPARFPRRPGMAVKRPLAGP